MAVSDVVKGTEYKATLGDFQGFTFGYDMDGNRNPILGRGEDADPFILCLSSKAWVRQLIKAVQAVAAVDGAVFMLHMDGSFNLNLMGYPVIVVGVSDSSRNFHPLGLAIVSQTTSAIFTEVLTKFGDFVAQLHSEVPWFNKVTHFMMDADVAEYNAVQAKFPSAVVLMCYFHVMYDVNKRCKGLPGHCTLQIMKGLLFLYASISEEEYVHRSRRILAEWRLVAELYAFAQYFEQQWMANQKFNKWQIYHTHCGYAKTNNPVELFNRKIKVMTQRLVLKLPKLIETLLGFVTEQSTGESQPFRVALC
ncbi:MAG: hypothetical protein ACREBR_01560, partial [bacterium]